MVWMVGRTLVPGLPSCRAESGPVTVGLPTNEDISRKMQRAGRCREPSDGEHGLKMKQVKQVSRTESWREPLPDTV